MTCLGYILCVKNEQSFTVVSQACGPLNSFKRLITPANKPQGFGFAEFQDPEGALRALQLLNGVELPALEDGCAREHWPTCYQVKADEKTTAFLNAYQAQRVPTDVSSPSRLCIYETDRCSLGRQYEDPRSQGQN
jgi:RNA recognition motif